MPYVLFMICFSVILLVLTLLGHACVNRILGLLKLYILPQVVLIGLILAINLMLIVFSVILFFTISDPFFYIYIFIYSNCFLYCYFHLFNLSQTGRRIKLLRLIEKEHITENGQIIRKYNKGDVIAIRLKRVIDSGQAVKKEGRYFISRKLLYNAGKLIRFYRKLLNYK